SPISPKWRRRSDRVEPPPRSKRPRLNHMDLERLGRTWDRLGRRDPLWAVLTHPEKKGGRWNLEEFLATGEAEIAKLFATLEERRIEVEYDVAVDFGCGVGRLTQPLARRFQTVYGID